jgi:SAM-dependent methyltransferase
MAEFDRIAPVYDETRGSLPAAALEALRTTLTQSATTSVLEVGVGTGRVSIPLQNLGWVVTGVDLSTGMLLRARRKGLRRLVRANAEHLPFADATFDSAILAHVLHVFDDPSAALRETARVTRGRILALLRSSSGSSPNNERRRQVWALLQELRAQYGLPSPSRPRRWWREAALLRSAPPLEIHELPESSPGRSVEDWISGLEKRAYSGLADVPDDVLQRIVRELRQRIRDLPAQGPRKERLAIWRPEQLRELPTLVPESAADRGVSGEPAAGREIGRGHAR